MEVRDDDELNSHSEATARIEEVGYITIHAHTHFDVCRSPRICCASRQQHRRSFGSGVTAAAASTIAAENMSILFIRIHM